MSEPSSFGNGIILFIQKELMPLRRQIAELEKRIGELEKQQAPNKFSFLRRRKNATR
jgi:hypothetical protein